MNLDYCRRNRLSLVTAPLSVQASAATLEAYHGASSTRSTEYHDFLGEGASTLEAETAEIVE
jgi:hypothetical protein